MEKRARLTQIGNIRALAIFLVVLGHSIILYSGVWELYETTRQVPALQLLYRGVNLIQMPLFFSLSGYLFVFTHGKNRGFPALVRAKALRLLVPYVGIAALYMIPLRLAIGYPGYRGLSAGDLALRLLTGTDVGHLWFLPALFFVFLLSEGVLRAAHRVPGLRKCPALVLCAVSLALYLWGWRISFGYPPLQSAFSYMLWFALGYFLCVHRQLLTWIYGIGWSKWGLPAVNLVLLLCCLGAESPGVLPGLAVRGLTLVNLYGAAPHKRRSLPERIDRNSFGIYLFHSPLIYLTAAFLPEAPPAAVVCINLVLFGAAAYGLTVLVRKTKLRVLMGE